MSFYLLRHLIFAQFLLYCSFRFVSWAALEIFFAFVCFSKKLSSLFVLFKNKMWFHFSPTECCLFHEAFSKHLVHLFSVSRTNIDFAFVGFWWIFLWFSNFLFLLQLFIRATKGWWLQPSADQARADAFRLLCFLCACSSSLHPVFWLMVCSLLV